VRGDKTVPLSNLKTIKEVKERYVIELNAKDIGID
jgi:hypothetical protein